MTIPFLQVQPKAIKLKVSPRFPALLIGRTGIAVNKANGNYYLDLAYQTLPFSPVVPANNQVAVYDPVSGHYTNVPALQLGGGITTDAPLDGFTYGRNNAGWSRALDLALGGTITGNVTFNGTATFGGQTIVPTPTAATQAANKSYVDGAVGAAAGTALPLMNGAAAVGVSALYARQDHVHPTDTTRAPLASPAFTGTPTAPTPPVNDNSTKLATTAYVIGQAATVAPLMNGAAAAGASLLYARQDHVHPSDTTKLSDAPADGNIYGRKNNAWAVTTGGGGVFMRSYLAGLTLSTAGSSATFTVQPGLAADSTSADYLSLAAAMSKTTAAWAAGSGNGAWDGSGSNPATSAAWYHVFLIKNTSTQAVDVVISPTTVPANGPNTMPSGYTLFRRIGAIKTNASGQWVLFYQLGDYFYWATPVTDVNANTSLGTAVTPFTLSVPPGVNVLVWGTAAYSNTVAGHVLLIQSGFTNTLSSAVSGLVTIYENVASALFFTETWLMTNTSAQINAQTDMATGNTWYFVTRAWVDRRGRDT